MTVYIYCITNKFNNKSYIGQSIDAEDRWKDHISDAERSVGKTASTKKFAIQNAIAKYGKENFIWQVIDCLNTIEKSNEAEEFYIAYLETLAPNGYNLTSGGRNSRPSQSTKEKIREKLKIVGNFVGKKGKDHPNFGTHFSDERKSKQSKKLSGDNGPGKKINSKIARQIYLEYLNNKSIFPIDLADKYNLGINTVRNILKKKSWKEALKNLPDINLEERDYNHRRKRGSDNNSSKLKECDVINIIKIYKTQKYTMQELANKYQVGLSTISSIIHNKNWKHIKR